MPVGEPDDSAEKLFIDLPEDVGGDDRELIGAFGIVETAQDVAQKFVVEIEIERQFVGIFVTFRFFLEMEQAGVVTRVGVLKQSGQARINAVAVDEGAEPAVILNAAVFTNPEEDDAINDALDGKIQFALRKPGIAKRSEE